METNCFFDIFRESQLFSSLLSAATIILTPQGISSLTTPQKYFVYLKEIATVGD
jgi:hypothetical protein